MNIAEFRAVTRKAAALLKAMGNERRLMILCELGRGERTVGDLVPLIGLSQSALSQQLAVLRQSGLVTCRRHSQHVYYSLAGVATERVIEALYEIYCPTAKTPGTTSNSDVEHDHNVKETPCPSTVSS